MLLLEKLTKCGNLYYIRQRKVTSHKMSMYVFVCAGWSYEQNQIYTLKSELLQTVTYFICIQKLTLSKTTTCVFIFYLSIYLHFHNSINSSRII